MKTKLIYIILFLIITSCVEILEYEKVIQNENNSLNILNQEDVKLEQNIQICKTDNLPSKINNFYDFHEFKCKRYFLSKLKLSWIDADKLSKDLGGYLAYPNDKEESDFLVKMIENDNHSLEIVWLGIYNINNKNNLTFSNNRDVKFVNVKDGNINWSNWEPNEPSNTSLNENVIEMYPKNGGTWNDHKAGSMRNFIIVFEKK